MRSVLIGFAVMALCLPLAAFGRSPEAVHAEIVRTVKIEAEAQAEYDRWVSEREKMSSEMRNLKAMDAWLEFRIQKYERYLLRQQATIAELESRKQEARRIEMELEPFLEIVMDGLEHSVAEDPPFLEQERRDRLDFLKTSLDDYHLGLSEKLRRAFEALHVEAEYGRSVSIEPGVVEMQGEPVQGRVFRLGRAALFFLAADGRAAVWDRRDLAWKAADRDLSRTIRNACDMAGKKRVVDLLDLPVGAVQ